MVLKSGEEVATLTGQALAQRDLAVNNPVKAGQVVGVFAVPEIFQARFKT